MDIITYLIIGASALVVGVVTTIVVQKSVAKSRAKAIIDEATAEAENIKKTKILEAREEELKIKAEAEKQANNRMAKIQQAEAKMKQRELQLNQQQSDNQRQSFSDVHKPPSFDAALCGGTSTHSMRWAGDRCVSLLRVVAADWLPIQQPCQRLTIKRHNRI